MNLQQIKYKNNKNKLYILYFINCFLLCIILGIYFKLS